MCGSGNKGVVDEIRCYVDWREALELMCPEAIKPRCLSAAAVEAIAVYGSVEESRGGAAPLQTAGQGRMR